MLTRWAHRSHRRRRHHRKHGQDKTRQDGALQLRGRLAAGMW